MTKAQLTKAPIAKAELLIRRPAADVYQAFVDPSVTTRFWFTKASGKLEPGKQVQWEWEMYDLSAVVTVKALEPNRRIVIEWPGNHGPTTVEWRFEDYDGATFVSIVNRGFGGSGDDQVAEAIDAAGGFALVLAGLKAALEHDIRLNLVQDRFAPKQAKACET
jgi:uncharacterized protein YndB with AHSA1/START domain